MKRVNQVLRKVFQCQGLNLLGYDMTDGKVLLKEQKKLQSGKLQYQSHCRCQLCLQTNNRVLFACPDQEKVFPPQIMGNNTCFTIHTVSSLLGGVMSKTFVITIIIFISNSLDHLLLTCTIRITSPKLQYRLCKLLIVSL